MTIKTMQNALESEMPLNSVSSEKQTNTLSIINNDGSRLELCRVPTETMYGFSLFWGTNPGNMDTIKVAKDSDTLATQAFALTPIDKVHYKTAYGKLYAAAIDRELTSLVTSPKLDKAMLDLHKLKKTAVITLALDDCNGHSIEHFQIKAGLLPTLVAMINANSKAFGERVVAILQLPQLEDGGFYSVFGTLSTEMLGRMLQNLFVTKILSTAKVVES